MNSAWQVQGEAKMRLRIGKKGKWVILLPAFVMTFLPAMAQQTKANVPSSTEQPSKAKQPIAGVDNSRVDAKNYVIGENDVLDIDVWKEKEISRTIPVRPDGKISLPLIGEIQASGMTPLQLQDDIAQKLKAFLANPEVTVIVSDPRSQHFNIVGEVAKPGAYPLSQSTTVLDAISMAGGFRDFAKETKIYVLRAMPGGSQARLPFNYKDVIKGKKPENNVVLKPGDTIVVP